MTRTEWDGEPEPCDWCQRTSCNHGSKCRYVISERSGPIDLCPRCDGGVVTRAGPNGMHTCQRGHTFRPSQYDAIRRSRA